MKHYIFKIKGFTLVELMVSVAIFAMMTALLLARYGNFNQGILLTNLAYDIALTIRNAQSYGLNVKSAPSNGQNYSEQFNFSYGVNFKSNQNNQFIFFADANNDGIYNGGDTIISTSKLKSNVTISNICINESPCLSSDELNITFRRPNPDAVIRSDVANPPSVPTYAKITIKGTDNTIRNIIVRSTGQIAVEN